jgi:hypothetical protein
MDGSTHPVDVNADVNLTVTLLLRGGHRSSLRLAKNDPLLRSLLASIEDKADGGSRVTRPYNLRLDEGRQSLIFAGRDLVGLTIDPPLSIETREPAGPSLKSLEVKPAPAGQHASRFRLVENFFDPRLHAELLAFAMREAARFVDATVSTKDADYRRSKVLYELADFSRVFRDRIAALAPRLMQDFGLAPFPVADVEC